MTRAGQHASDRRPPSQGASRWGDGVGRPAGSERSQRSQRSQNEVQSSSPASAGAATAIASAADAAGGRTTCSSGVGADRRCGADVAATTRTFGRALAAEPLETDRALALEGSGWDGDLDEMRESRVPHAG